MTGKNYIFIMYKWKKLFIIQFDIWSIIKQPFHANSELSAKRQKYKHILSERTEKKKFILTKDWEILS